MLPRFDGKCFYKIGLQRSFCFFNIYTTMCVRVSHIQDMSCQTRGSHSSTAATDGTLLCPAQLVKSLEKCTLPLIAVSVVTTIGHLTNSSSSDPLIVLMHNRQGRS